MSKYRLEQPDIKDKQYMFTLRLAGDSITGSEIVYVTADTTQEAVEWAENKYGEWYKVFVIGYAELMPHHNREKI